MVAGSLFLERNRVTFDNGFTAASDNFIPELDGGEILSAGRQVCFLHVRKETTQVEGTGSQPRFRAKKGDVFPAFTPFRGNKDSIGGAVYVHPLLEIAAGAQPTLLVEPDHDLMCDRRCSKDNWIGRIGQPDVKRHVPAAGIVRRDIIGNRQKANVAELDRQRLCRCRTAWFLTKNDCWICLDVRARIQPIPSPAASKCPVGFHCKSNALRPTAEIAFPPCIVLGLIVTDIDQGPITTIHGDGAGCISRRCLLYTSPSPETRHDLV